MQCNRKVSVSASIGFGVICAIMALDTVPETPLAGRTTRGAGGVINGVVEAMGPTGAAIAFLLLGLMLAGISAALCPSSRR